jgi:hypothetical protein
MARRKRKILEAEGEGGLSRSQIDTALTSVHVLASVDGWTVRKAGPGPVSERFETRKDAISFAKQLASSAPRKLLLIHGPNGRISTQEVGPEVSAEGAQGQAA